MNMTKLSVCLGGVAGSITLASTSVREEPWWPPTLRQYVAAEIGFESAIAKERLRAREARASQRKGDGAGKDK